MKFSIDRELLQQTLIDVSRGLSDKKPLPVLTGIKIEATAEGLIFTTTNKEISVQIKLENIETLISLCQECDKKIKSGLIGGWAALETIIAEYKFY